MRAIPDSMDAAIVAAIDDRLAKVAIDDGVRIVWAIESGSRAWGFPSPDSDYDARVLSWVRASHAQLDTQLWRAVTEWLASDWPFGSVEYAPRA